MTVTFDITPKLRIFNKGTCFKTKHEMVAHKIHEVSGKKFDENISNDLETVIPKNTCLIFLEDRQFYSPSKHLHQPISAWFRARVITPLGDLVWITLCCEAKAVWDFKTYNGKKNAIIEEVNRSFDIIQISSESLGNTII